MHTVFSTVFKHHDPVIIYLNFQDFSHLGGSFNHRAPVAHLVVHRAETREVVSSRLRPDTQGLKITEEKSAAFVISSTNG